MDHHHHRHGHNRERSERSVFVGNIPYEATEEDLKEIFSQIGPVIAFRLVCDRESGKPKGYGFCEYVNAETAHSAMRNLNGMEFRGRNLRVDSSSGEKSREELERLQAQMGPPPEESPYGPPVDPDKAPEAISRAVASLPPEQMFELMKQMKLCVLNNPHEARSMLMQNPQLAFALLQAQVVMRIVEPQVAMAMLHRNELSGQQPSLAPGGPPGPAGGVTVPPVSTAAPVPPMAGGPAMGSGMPGPPMGMGPGPGMPPGPGPIVPPVGGPMGPPPGNDQDYRGFPGPQVPPVSTGPPLMGAGVIPPVTTGPDLSGLSTGLPADDQEKANLIMQVLQLTDEQIAVLPGDQRQSVLMLKEQLKGSLPNA